MPAICALLDRVVRAGAFCCHRPLYDDETWVPDRLEYSVLVDDRLRSDARREAGFHETVPFSRPGLPGVAL